MSTHHTTGEWQSAIKAHNRPKQRAVEIVAIQPQSRGKLKKNVGNVERLLSLAGGTALALAGRQKRDGGGLLLALAGAGLMFRGATGYCGCYQALGISTACQADNSVIPAQQGVKLDKSMTINRPAVELYEFWRDVTNLPQVFKHLTSVTTNDGQTSHWVAEGPAGMSIEWDAEVLNDHEAQLIAWRSLPGSRLDTAGSVRFEPIKNDRGTVVTVSMKFNPPGGRVAANIAS